MTHPAGDGAAGGQRPGQDPHRAFRGLDGGEPAEGPVGQPVIAPQLQQPLRPRSGRDLVAAEGEDGEVPVAARVRRQVLLRGPAQVLGVELRLCRSSRGGNPAVTAPSSRRRVRSTSSRPDTRIIS